MGLKQIAELSKKNQPGIMGWLPDPSAPHPYIDTDRSAVPNAWLTVDRQEYEDEYEPESEEPES